MRCRLVIFDSVYSCARLFRQRSTLHVSSYRRTKAGRKLAEQFYLQFAWPLICVTGWYYAIKANRQMPSTGWPR